MLEKHAYLFFKKEKKLSDQRLSASQILTITNSKLRGIFTGKKKKHYSCSHISPWAYHAIFIFILVIKILFQAISSFLGTK
jgi:hypothetical protein